MMPVRAAWGSSVQWSEQGPRNEGNGALVKFSIPGTVDPKSWGESSWNIALHTVFNAETGAPRGCRAGCGKELHGACWNLNWSYFNPFPKKIYGFWWHNFRDNREHDLVRTSGLPRELNLKPSHMHVKSVIIPTKSPYTYYGNPAGIPYPRQPYQKSGSVKTWTLFLQRLTTGGVFRYSDTPLDVPLHRDGIPMTVFALLNVLSNSGLVLHVDYLWQIVTFWRFT